MDSQVLIDSIVRQTTVLIAQLATAGGVRAPLSHMANQMFLELMRALQEQGVSRKVCADMFGMAFRAYLRKIQRLMYGGAPFEIVGRELVPLPLPTGSLRSPAAHGNYFFAVNRSSSGEIVRVDPATGQSEIIVGLDVLEGLCEIPPIESAPAPRSPCTCSTNSTTSCTARRCRVDRVLRPVRLSKQPGVACVLDSLSAPAATTARRPRVTTTRLRRRVRVYHATIAHRRRRSSALRGAPAASRSRRAAP